MGYGEGPRAGISQSGQILHNNWASISRFSADSSLIDVLLSKAGLDFILPAVADGMSFSATGITLAVIRRQLKELHKKVDLLLSSVGETAKDKFEEAMVSLENDNFR